MKLKYLIILLAILGLILAGFYFYYFLPKKNLGKKTYIQTTTPVVSIKPKYKFFDEDLNNEIKYDNLIKGVLIGNMGLKKADKKTLELDKRKIYMPFDGKIKVGKIPADDPLGSLFHTTLTIHDPVKNKIIYIWGNFVPVNLNFEKEVFKSKGSVIAEFPSVNLEDTQDFFNDFIVIKVLDGKTYEEDLNELEEIFPGLKITK
ncbi:MAG: hypothetical protein QXE38_05240 [Candidatus Methanomethylicia archaeon]